MHIQDFFGDFPLKRFLDEHLYRLPLALPNVCNAFCALGNWSCVAAALAAPDADLMVVKGGARCEEALPRDLVAAQVLSRSGYTILVKHAERYAGGVKEIATVFSETFRAPVDIQLYATPAGSFGFSWHYDAEDVFILQTSGEKEYFLRKNTVNPWPLEQTLPVDMRYEREIMPLMRVVLRAGDLLYIPCGYWHRARTVSNSETAFSLAVGVMSRSAMEIFELLGNELVNSLVWRQRLPIPSSETSCDAIYEHILAQLASDLTRTITGTSFRARLRDQFY
jgi:ribosomal protein L16 Arg81 hydroxylase